MKNKLLVLLVAFVYILGMFSLPLYADEADGGTDGGDSSVGDTTTPDDGNTDTDGGNTDTDGGNTDGGDTDSGDTNPDDDTASVIRVPQYRIIKAYDGSMLAGNTKKVTVELTKSTGDSVTRVYAHPESQLDLFFTDISTAIGENGSDLTLEFNVTAASYADGRYDVPFILEMYNGDSYLGESTVSVSVIVTNPINNVPDAVETEYTVGSVTGNIMTYAFGSRVEVELVHTAGNSAYGIIANAAPSSSLTVSNISYTSYGSRIYLSFYVMAESGAEGYHDIPITLTYMGTNGINLGTGNINVPITVIDNTDPDGLSFVDYTVSKNVIVPGDHFTISYVLNNDTGMTLYDVEVSLPGLDPSKFVLDGGFTSKKVSIMSGASTTVTFELIACEGISSVRETISASAGYTISDQACVADCDVVLTCEPKSGDSSVDSMSLTMVKYTSSSDRIRPGRTFKLSITVKNSSDEDIEKARINIQNLDGRVFAVDSGLTYRDFAISAGETKTLEFTLIGCEGISSTREVLPVEISYGGISEVVYCTLSCKPEQSDNTVEEQVFAPNIIITDYDFGGEFVVAGQKFPLTVTFQNMSDTATIENLKIIIDGGVSTNGGIAFSASNSANSFFFEKLDPKATDKVVIELLSKADATPDSYPIEISFSYEYTVNGKRYQANTIEETLNVPLQQEDRLVVNEPSYPNWVVYVGDSCFVSTSLVNMGKSGVYNVTASIQGEGFTMNEASYYIGNIESGREEYYDTELYPNMAGEINAELVITYEDSNGNAKEKRIPFTIQVQEMMDYGPVVDVPIIGEDVGVGEDGYYDEFGNWIPNESSENGLPAWAWYAIGGGGAVVVIILIVVIAKAKKKKKMALELEDEDEDI